MHALITGATGFIGRHLVNKLTEPVVLTRNPTKATQTLGTNIKAVAWDPKAGPPPAEAFDGVDTVFNLAGESIMGRWNEDKKREIRDSRITGTRNLVQGMKDLTRKPAVLISASATGYYGDRGDELLDENAPPGHDFLADICRDWEAEALRAQDFGLRVVIPRIGLVLGPNGGALAAMITPFKLGLGAKLGNGRQWMPWIHIDDLIDPLLFAAQTANLAGPFNAVAPHPVTNSEFTRTLAAALNRPAFLTIPPFALRLVLGEAAKYLLASERAVPRRIEQAGYQFHFPDLATALNRALIFPPRRGGRS